MAFRTKLDFSDNRQVKQRIETTTVLSGATNFGVPFADLPSGADTSTSGETNSYSIIFSTFSGNSVTTIYNWYDPSMVLGETFLSALTPSNSATTQTVDPVFVPSIITVIDGNTVALEYSGVTFDITPNTMVDLGGGNYSGTVETNELIFLSASTLDFTGRTIWVDVSGITRTDRLIINRNPVVGYVWTCDDVEGMGSWQPATGGSGSTIWVSGSGSGSAMLYGGFNDASGPFSVAEGQTNVASGNSSHAEGSVTIAGGIAAHAEGSNTQASGDSSHAEGYATKAEGIASHAEGKANIASGDGSHAEGNLTIASGQASHAEGLDTIASGDGGHAEGRLTIAIGDYSHAEGSGTTATTISSHAEGVSTLASGLGSHAEGSNTIASGKISHAGGYYTQAIGDYSYAGGINSVAAGQTSFVYGDSSAAEGKNTIVLGANLIGKVDDTTYVDYLNVNRILSTAFANDIRIDANGNLTTNTSDERLKENINPLTNALDKIKNLQGVTYQWKDKNAGGDSFRLGFIAQQVETVEPLLVFTNKNDENGYKGIHIDGIIPLLVEAVKELSVSGVTENKFLQTQTVLAEDNNIDLNYNGTPETAVNGGIRVLNAKGSEAAELLTNSNGDWVTNNDFKPNSLTIPQYTPSSSSDEVGNVGNVTRDDDYIYIKTSTGWKRANLESF